MWTIGKTAIFESLVLIFFLSVYIYTLFHPLQKVIKKKNFQLLPLLHYKKIQGCFPYVSAIVKNAISDPFFIYFFFYIYTLLCSLFIFILTTVKPKKLEPHLHSQMCGYFFFKRGASQRVAHFKVQLQAILEERH